MSSEVPGRPLPNTHTHKHTHTHTHSLTHSLTHASTVTQLLPIPASRSLLSLLLGSATGHCPGPRTKVAPSPLLPGAWENRVHLQVLRYQEKQNSFHLFPKQTPPPPGTRSHTLPQYIRTHTRTYTLGISTGKTSKPFPA